MFTDRDKEVGYDENECTAIQLSDDGSSCDSQSVSIEGQTVTITEEGTYLLSGSLSDGSVVIYTDENVKVRLILNGVSINSSSSAAIYVKSADKVFITLAPDTENVLSNGGTYETVDDNNIDSAIFSKSDLTLNGSGSLKVTAKEGHGVVSKDDLVITGGTYNIEAASQGLSGKDSIRILDGDFTVTAGKDALHAKAVVIQRLMPKAMGLIPTEPSLYQGAKPMCPVLSAMVTARWIMRRMQSLPEAY